MGPAPADSFSTDGINGARGPEKGRDYLNINEDERKLENSIRLSSLQTALTEKIGRALRDMAASLGAELEVAEDFGRRLASSQRDVQQGCATLEAQCQSLQQFSELLRNETEALRTRNDAARAGVDQLEEATQHRRLHQTQNPVEAQLLRTQSEEYALEDVAYMLQKGLEAGHVNLDVCLKSIRLLAAEQFQKKALAAKISAILAQA